MRLPPVVRRRGARLLSRAEVRLPRSRAVLAPLQRRLFDGAAPVWDRLRDQGSVERLLGDALDALGPFAPARILDLGTGTGQAAFALARRFPEAAIVAVDGSAAMIERARRKLGAERIEFRVGDAGSLPFADGSFELAVSLCVQPFPAETARLLAPQGIALYAYSNGPDTPIWFSPDTLARLLRPHALDPAGTGEREGGVWAAFRMLSPLPR